MFLKALLTSLQGEEEISVPLELLHELLVLQEQCDALVLQVLLPAPLLLQRALAPRGRSLWLRPLVPTGALAGGERGSAGSVASVPVP